MPSAPSQCWIRKVPWKPTNRVQKVILPSRSSSILPVNLGHQKWKPENIANTTVPKTTEGKWATTEEEPVTGKTSGGEARMTPVRPPKRKVTRKPTDHSMGVSKLNDPRHMVPVQLKNLTPVGMAMRKVMNEKNGSNTAPVANMWCAHTVTDRPAMAMVAPIRPR